MFIYFKKAKSYDGEFVMKNYLSKLIKKTGFPPGTAVHIGPKFQDKTNIFHVLYGSKTLKCTDIKDIKKIKVTKKEGLVNWFDIRSLQDIESINTIGKKFKVHALIVEDILNTVQLPKIEEHDTHFFLIIKAINFQEETLNFEHICLFFQDRLILSFQEKISDTFKVVRDRILNQKGKIAEKEADYLLYALFDYVIDTYFESLQKIDNHISELNEEVDSNLSQDTLKRIQTLKKQILILKRHFWYTRDIVLTLKKSESSLISSKTDKYLTDLNDHIAHIIDISESFREELIDLTERHLSAINLRSNDIMKMLTIVAAIFMPLTFLAGIYGMNFKVMPELDWPLSYPILISIMVVIAIGLLALFKKKRWFD